MAKYAPVEFALFVVRVQGSSLLGLPATRFDDAEVVDGSAERVDIGDDFQALRDPVAIQSIIRAADVVAQILAARRPVVGKAACHVQARRLNIVERSRPGIGCRARHDQRILLSDADDERSTRQGRPEGAYQVDLRLTGFLDPCAER